MSNFTISAIIPTYNRAHLVCDAIDSVLAQTYPCHEIIVVDDGSTDNTHNVLSGKYGDKIISLRQDNRGVSAARNLGIATATGEWIAFLDSDDLWLTQKLEKQVAALHGKPDAAMCYCYAVGERDNGVLVGPDVIYGNKNRPELFGSLISGDWINTPAMMVKKDALNYCGCFNENIRIGEDWVLWMTLSCYYDAVEIDDVLVRTRQLGDNISHHTALAAHNYLKAFTIIKNLPLAREFHGAIQKKAGGVYREVGICSLNDQKRLLSIYWLTRSILNYPKSLFSWRCLFQAFLPEYIFHRLGSVKRRFTRRKQYNI